MIKVVRTHGEAIPAWHCLVEKFSEFFCNSDCSHIYTVTEAFHPIYEKKVAKNPNMARWSK